METHPSRGRAIAGAATAGQGISPSDYARFLYIAPGTGEMPTILQPGKISRCSAVSRQTFPKNRSSFSWGRTIPWVSHILYLIGNGMQSAGSTNAHCS